MHGDESDAALVVVTKLPRECVLFTLSCGDSLCLWQRAANVAAKVAGVRTSTGATV